MVGQVQKEQEGLADFVLALAIELGDEVDHLLIDVRLLQLPIQNFQGFIQAEGKVLERLMAVDLFVGFSVSLA